MNVVIYLLLLTGILAVILFIATIPFIKERTALIFALLVLAFAFYILGYFFELKSTNVENLFNCIRFEYVGITLIPPLWILFLMKFVNSDAKIKPRFALLLFFIPAATLVILNTNPLHHFYYTNITMETINGLTISHLEKGPWYWVQNLYFNVAVLFGVFILIRAYRKSSDLQKKRVLNLFIASLFPWIFYIFYMTGLNPSGIDFSFIGYIFTAFLFFYNLYRYKLFDVLPVARDSLFIHIQDGVFILDPKKAIVDVNDSALKMFKLDKSPVGKLVDTVDPLLAGVFDGADHYIHPIEMIFNNDTGNCWLEVRSTVLKDRFETLRGYLVIVHDITHRKLMEEQLRLAAITDALTDLPNRRQFEERFVESVHIAARYGLKLSLCICDIDFFKLINDRYGHSTGDIAIKIFAESIFTEIRDTDFVARYGGDEFCILFTNTPADKAVIAVDRIRNRLKRTPFLTPDGTEFFVTGSFGLANMPESDKNGSELTERADAALYVSKNTGRDKVTLWKPGMIHTELAD